MWQAIQPFVDGLAEVTEEEELFRRLEAVAVELGYPYYAFGALWGDPEAIGPHQAPAVRLNYPDAWIAHYFQQGYDKIDPVVLIAPYATTSVTWDDLRGDRPEFFAEAAQYGLRDGISIPLRGIQGTYVVCFVSDIPQPFPLLERARLEVLAAGFFGAYQRVRQIVPVDHGMSPNTIDVIRLSMAGLPVDEIAERLRMTSHGVYWCMKDAKKKLKCANAAQVYLKAIQLGIVAV